MTPAAVIELVGKLKARLNSDAYVPKQANTELFFSDTSNAGGDHMRWMLEQIPEIHAADPEKAGRWLGFIQGVLWTTRYYTINELRDMTRESSP